MEAWNGKNYSRIIGYGIGQYYEKTKEELAGIIRLDYLCDRKWDGTDKKEHDGIPVVRRQDLKDIGDALLVIFAGNSWIYQSICDDLDELDGVDHVHVDEMTRGNRRLNGKTLREQYPDGIYEDMRNNKIYFDHSLPDMLTVSFRGSNNELYIEKNVLMGNVHIWFGRDRKSTRLNSSHP